MAKLTLDDHYHSFLLMIMARQDWVRHVFSRNVFSGNIYYKRNVRINYNRLPAVVEEDWGKRVRGHWSGLDNENRWKSSGWDRLPVGSSAFGIPSSSVVTLKRKFFDLYVLINLPIGFHLLSFINCFGDRQIGDIVVFFSWILVTNHHWLFFFQSLLVLNDHHQAKRRKRWDKEQRAREEEKSIYVQ